MEEVACLMRKLMTGLSRVVRAELGRWLRCVPEVELRTWLRWHDGQDDETAREPGRDEQARTCASMAEAWRGQRPLLRSS